MRSKKEIVVKLGEAIGETPKGFETATALLPILEVLTDIRDTLVDIEASTQVYRCEALRFKQWELDKK